MVFFLYKDRLAIAIRSLKDRCVTIVSLTQVLVECVVGGRLVVLASFPTLYGKVPRLILNKTSRLTQVVVFYRRHFLCGALLCNCSSAKREGLSTHVQRECSAEPFMRTILSLKTSHLSPVLAYDFLSRYKFSTPPSTPLHSSINRLYAQNPVLELVHDGSVKVFLHMYNGNVQHNPLCVDSCVSKELSISPRFSPTVFDPDANSVLSRAHLCTVTDSMRRKPCSKLLKRA